MSNDADLESVRYLMRTFVYNLTYFQVIDTHEPSAYWRTARLEDERGNRYSVVARSSSPEFLGSGTFVKSHKSLEI